MVNCAHSNHKSLRAVIAPSILACDLTRLGEAIQAVEKGGADWHHVDVMDGHFVPNLTFGPDIVKAVKKAGARPIDVHLMVANPERHAEQFIEAGADSVTFHIEVSENPRPLLREIQALGARAGLVVKPKTPAASLFPYLDEIEIVLVMTVEPGFTGQKFMPDCVEKIAELRREAGEALDIEVDGGINAETVALTAAAGANVVVAGAAVYRADDIAAAISKIRATMQENYRAAP